MKNNKWLVEILKQIDYECKNCWSAVSKIGFLEVEGGYINEGEQKSEIDHQEEILIDSLNKIHIKVIFTFEFLGLIKLRKEYFSEYKNYKDSLGEIKINHYVDYAYSPILEVMEKYVSVLRAFDDNNNNITSHKLLERILRGTPKILVDANVMPKNESDVKRVINNLLIHTFPDTVPEASISKVTKCYKPDFAIKSLKAVIEYKFVASEKEAKKTLGEIYEDICGYEDENWKSFYAVIYMTDVFFTEDQIKAEFEMAKVNEKWFPIIVYGNGKRKRKKT